MLLADLATALNKIHDENVATAASITAELNTLNANINILTAELANTGTTPAVDAALAGVQSSADSLAALVPATPSPAA